MYKVDIEKQCGCYKKDHLDLPRSYDTQEQAELEGLRLVNHMNTNYCKKHRFYLSIEESGFLIKSEESCKS